MTVPAHIAQPHDLALLHRVDSICDAFERAWQAGTQARVEEYLESDPMTTSTVLLENLLALEIEYRRKRGERVGRSELEARFPNDTDMVAALLTETSLVRLGDPPSADPRRGLPGNGRLGRFELVEVLGRGSSGTVYLARDGSLERNVAIKVAHPGLLATDGAYERFFREAKNAAGLSHRGIVQVFEPGAADGTAFIVSEYIAGPTLAQLARHAMSEDFRSIAQLVADVAEALEHAHQSGIVHRDLKPSNIVMTWGGPGSLPNHCRFRGWQPKITDFGLARQADANSELTRTGEILGTPAYMSPEQAAGDCQSVDPRSDVFSLGVVLFELLTHQRPFNGEMPEIFRQIQEDAPPSPRRLKPRIPRDLEVICLKCLEKAPADRYQSAGEVRSDLERWLLDLPILARPTPRYRRMWQWCGKRPRQLALVGASLLIAAIGLGGTAWQRAARLETERVNASFQADEWTLLPSARLRDELPRIRDITYATGVLYERLSSEPALTPQQRFRVHLALLREHPDVAAQLLDYMLGDADPYEFSIAAAELLPYAHRLKSASLRAGELASLDENQNARRLLALIALRLVPENPDAADPDGAARLIAEWLADRKPEEDVAEWLRRAGEYDSSIEAELRSLFLHGRDDGVRNSACRVLIALNEARPERLASLVRAATDSQHRLLSGALATNRSAAISALRALLPAQHDEDHEPVDDGKVADEEQWPAYANVLCALVRLGAGGEVWPRLSRWEDPRLLTYFIHKAAALKLDVGVLLDRLIVEEDASVQFALLLTLGSYPDDAFSETQQSVLSDWLHQQYPTHPDGGVHGAIRWFLQKRGQFQWIASTDKRLIGPPVPGRGWYLNSRGLCMVIVRSENPSSADQPIGQAEFDPRERDAWKQVRWTFAVSADEITWDDFKSFDPSFKSPYGRDFLVDGQIPVFGVKAAPTALEYCRWLTREDGLLGQAVIATPDAGRYVVDPNQPGYRLPTEVEWERACRGGSFTSRYYGGAHTEYSHSYVHVNGRSATRVGQRYPNRFGIFDMLGNLREWTIDELMTNTGQRMTAPLPLKRVVGRQTRLATLGGNWEVFSADAHAGARLPQLAGFEHPGIGFRVVRTIQIPLHAEE